MARYWVFLNGKVQGPYGVEQLIRLRGFSRQSQICVDDASGQPQNWITPAEIPELSHIFKAIDEQLAAPPAMPKAVTKKGPIVPRTYTPAVVMRSAPGMSPTTKGWILLSIILLGSAAGVGIYHAKHTALQREHQLVRSLIENLRLPSQSPYATLAQMFAEKAIKPKWEYDKKEEGLYQVSVSWYAASAGVKLQTLNVYAFEVNAPAQTVRALNSAASKLLNEGFSTIKPPPSETKAKPEESKKTDPTSIDETLNIGLKAREEGDFQTVWNQFSKRKKAEMAKGGISKDGFIRLQGLTHRVEGAMQYQLVKSKKESDTESLVLIKQVQEGRPDMFIKQFWVLEDHEWKMDDEEKKNAQAPAEPVVPNHISLTPSPSAGAEPAGNSPKTPPPASLPGMSN